MTSTALPGLDAVVERPPVAPEPLRTDIAAFVGRSRRGPVGRATAVQGWREFRARYGGLGPLSDTSFAVRAYFDNGGDVAWVLRVEGPTATAATGTWRLGTVVDGTWDASSPGRGAFAARAYTVVATSPGSWANGTRVTFRFRASGIEGRAELDVRVAVPGEEPEVVERVAPRRVADAIAGSASVRLVPIGDEVDASAAQDRGPTSRTWEVTLTGGTDVAPSRTDYVTAAGALAELSEPALVVAPDLYRDVASDEQRREVIARFAADAARLVDRLVLLDVPPGSDAPQDAVAWVDELRRLALPDGERRRAVAVYHPLTCVSDPFGGAGTPLRAIPAAGPVAGVTSRMDRERGAHHTPANATVHGVVDLGVTMTPPEESLLHDAGINPLRCTPGRGVQIWGGRTLDRDPQGTFVAHRRLVHRLIRAIQRVAQPLVFDPNGPELWLTLVRAITTVLLEAFRSGALAGAVPDEAFRVQCDEELNPRDRRDTGQVLCRIAFAPATPMEFITLRLTFGLQGQLEVVEA